MDVEKLLNEIKGSETLQKELQGKSKDEFDAFLKEKGYNVTADDLIRHVSSASGNELDDAVLDSVSGGNVWKDLKEFFKWLKYG